MNVSSMTNSGDLLASPILDARHGARFLGRPDIVSMKSYIRCSNGFSLKLFFFSGGGEKRQKTEKKETDEKKCVFYLFSICF